MHIKKGWYPIRLSAKDRTMKEIGGFFGLELHRATEYYNDAIKVNSGRNTIKYILLAQKIKTVYIPYFICEAVIEPIKTLGVTYRFYAIDTKLEIADIFPDMLQKDEKILYINYFGVKDAYVDTLAEKFGRQLIVDNTQAFYKKPLKNTDTCYSPRKFFGVPDGGYLYTETLLDEEFEQDHSYDRCQALLGGIDMDAASFYMEYRKQGESLRGLPLKKMSRLTQSLLAGIDYEQSKLVRERNYRYLHNELKTFNTLEIEHSQISGPMIYPFLIEIEGLREYLIEQKIYVATYWKEVLDYVDRPDTVEEKLTRYLHALPIDQRYGIAEIHRIAVIVKRYIEEHRK